MVLFPPQYCVIDFNLSTCVFKHSSATSFVASVLETDDGAGIVTLLSQLYPHLIPCSFVNILSTYKNREVLWRAVIH